jgi:glycoside/pentoside/hexuronide:cation symporter, GPH family
LRLKSDYGIGQAGEGIKNGALGWFLLFYYSQVLGMDPGLAAVAAGTSVIIDAFTDPLAGSLSDNWRSARWGRRHPFMFAAAIPLGISFFLLFNPLVSGDWALFVWMVVFANLARTAMTLYLVPHLALGAEMSNDFRERTSVVGYRVFFGNLGALLAVVLGFALFFGPTAEFANGQLNAAAYPPFAALMSVLMVGAIVWSAWRTRGVIPYLPQPAAEAPLRLWAVLVRMVTDVKLALRCGSFRWLFLGVLILFVIIGVDSALNLYMNTYYWELTRNEIILLALPYPIGVMLGAVVSPWLQSRFGKKNMLLFGTASWALWQALPVLLRMADLMPANASAYLVPTLFAMRIIQGICTVHSNVAYGAMVADTIDEHELDTGKRQEGIFFSASSFSAKAPVGLGTIIAGYGLSLIDWPTGSAIRTAADVPPETVANLGLLFGPFIAGFAIVCLWCYSRYDLSRERHAEILELLERRRASVSVNGAPIAAAAR